MMKTILQYVVFIVVTYISSTSADSADADPFVKYEVVPDLIPKSPGSIAQVTYPGGIVVEPGCELTIKDVVLAPSVNFTDAVDKLYTLIMLDPDVPSPLLPVGGPFLHWLVGNIKLGDVSTGEEVAPYMTPTPPPLTCFHRYVILVFEQLGKVDYDSAKIYAILRLRFPLEKFIKKYDLGDLTAGNFFRTKFLSTLKIPNKLC